MGGALERILPEIFACPVCHAHLAPSGDGVACTSGHRFQAEGGSVNFLGTSESESPDQPWAALGGPDYESEMAGMRRRATQFILPRIQRRFGVTSGIRVLDDGCGGGGTVQELFRNGIDAYGIDPGVRRAAWAALSMSERLCVADGTHLPFVDQAFHAVLSSGVLEHVGEGDPNGPEEARRSYIDEMIRVLRPGGFALIAHPNGAHVIDYWHPLRGSVRWHRPYEGWMPAARDLRRWASLAGPPVRVRTLSPEGYLGFQRSRRHLYGRLLYPAGLVLMKLLTVSPALASSPLNPFLVTEVTRL